jgi:hypothetical protein
MLPGMSRAFSPEQRQSAAPGPLSGSGAVVLELSEELASVPCVRERPLLVRREWIVGWLGRLLPRPLPPAESPNGQRGLIAFSGEGTVLICAG